MQRARHARAPCNSSHAHRTAPAPPQSPNSFFMDVKCQGCFNM